MVRNPVRAPLADLAIVEIDQSDVTRVLEAHVLLRETMGPERVEDVDSFRATVSPATDDALVPVLVCATRRGRVEGAVMGGYLVNLNMGMVFYAGVRPESRRLGIYSGLRARLIAMLDGKAARHGQMDYLISEQEDGSTLFVKYTEQWGAFVAPIDYEQPATQGLTATKLMLVLQPMARRTRPSKEETLAIVREIYERVYRLPDVTANAQFRHVVESLAHRSNQGQQAH